MMGRRSRIVGLAGRRDALASRSASEQGAPPGSKEGEMIPFSQIIQAGFLVEIASTGRGNSKS
jgi:hypothetical protein